MSALTINVTSAETGTPSGTCGRMTKSTGAPCHAMSSMGGAHLPPEWAAGPCTQHATDDDRAFYLLASVINTTAQAVSSSALEKKVDAEVVRRLTIRSSGSLTGPFRSRTDAGEQIVVVTGGLTYSWNNGRDLRIGQQVVVPTANPAKTIKKRVIALGSDYTGALASVIAVVAEPNTTTTTVTTGDATRAATGTHNPAGS